MEEHLSSLPGDAAGAVEHRTLGAEEEVPAEIDDAPAIPAPIPASGLIPNIADHVVELQQDGGHDRWRVLVDGLPVPMTFTETESDVSGAGLHYERVLRAPAAADWVALGTCVAQKIGFSVSSYRSTWRACCRWRPSKGITIYNTVMHGSELVELTFPTELNAVTVRWNHHSDGSS
jgi:hypothetical protein